MRHLKNNKVTLKLLTASDSVINSFLIMNYFIMKNRNG
ncbi:hypothetical protein JOC76_002451 [Neobacillus cucumis]|nr:hypothetical protein [Neobacillus cucumis]